VGDFIVHGHSGPRHAHSDCLQGVHIPPRSQGGWGLPDEIPEVSERLEGQDPKNRC
jgi:hypothetical protein